MMNVFEFIREKKADLKDNTEQYRIKLEPKFKSISNKINHRLKNTLNNPWVSNLKSIDSSYFFGQRHSESNPTIKIVHGKIKEVLGNEIFVGNWEKVDQGCINGFANLTGDEQWIHTNMERASKESPFKTTIAHGFLTLSEIAEVQYKTTNYWDRNHEKTIIWNDKSLKINWPLEKTSFDSPTLSEKDLNAQSFKEVQLSNSLFK